MCIVAIIYQWIIVMLQNIGYWWSCAPYVLVFCRYWYYVVVISYYYSYYLGINGYGIILRYSILISNSLINSYDIN